MILISDIHGCYYTLRRLLRKCPDEQVVFCGDLIDRGPHSRQVIEFAMQNNVPTVVGNHEDLCLAHFNRHPSDDPYDRDLWLYNGGAATLKSYPEGIPTSHMDWMRNLPVYLEFDKLLVSHTGHGQSLDRMTALWARDFYFPKDGKFRVFGHTPHKKVYSGSNYMCIDTGAAYKHDGYGKLTALQWPQLNVIQQDFDESPL